MRFMINYTYGWRPDLPDHRDKTFTYSIVQLPPRVDLRPQCPPVLDQGQLGSCTANSIANCYKFLEMKEGLTPVINPSRLFIYYNERKIENTIKFDAGAQIRDGFKTINHDGICDEGVWPYLIAKFKKAPPVASYRAAVKHTALEYQRLDNTNIGALKQCLADGYPFVLGFSVYESFESQEVAQTGVVNLPGNEKSLGGHAVLAVGYDDSTQRFLIMNSWGTGWGQQGYFTIPYPYLTNSNLADDFWTLRKVT